MPLQMKDPTIGKLDLVSWNNWGNLQNHDQNHATKDILNLVGKGMAGSGEL